MIEWINAEKVALKMINSFTKGKKDREKKTPEKLYHVINWTVFKFI